MFGFNVAFAPAFAKSIIVPDVSALFHLDGLTCAFNYDDFFDCGGGLECAVCVVLDGDWFASSEGAVCGYEDFCASVVYAVCEASALNPEKTTA